MKKVLSALLALSLSATMALSLVACGDKGPADNTGTGGGDTTIGGGGGTGEQETEKGMTQAKWEAAFAKADSLVNYTLVTGYTSDTTLYFDGAELTEDTDLGGGLTGKDILGNMDGEIGQTTYSTKFLLDAESGKLNEITEMKRGDRERNYTYYYRTDEAKIEETDYDGERYIYGPYKDEATAKKLVAKSARLGENISELGLTDKDGNAFNLKKDFGKLTEKDGAYSAELIIDMPVAPEPLLGTGTVTLTDDYVSSIKFDAETTLDAAEYDMPEGLTAKITVTAEVKIIDVGTTTVSDTDMPTPEEEDIHEYPVITTEEQFKSLFLASLDDGVGLYLSEHDDESYTHYVYELKKTDDGYNAFVREEKYVYETQTDTYKYFYYIATAAGIQKYESTGDWEITWGTPTKVSETGTLDALLALFPAVVGDYFATYDDGKTIDQLFSKFDYINMTRLSAELKNGTETVKVEISFYLYGENFSLNWMHIGENEIDSIGRANYIEYYNPLTHGQDQD